MKRRTTTKLKKNIEKKKICEMSKRILAIFLAMTICEVGFINTPLKVYAEMLDKERKEEKFKKSEPLNYFLYEEERKATGLMKNDVEKALNEQGIFDSELELFSEKEIEELEKAESMQVINEYIAINEENAEEKNIVEDNDINEATVLNDEEIDNLIEEIYYTESDDKDSVIENAGKKIGIIPEEVYGKDIDANSTSYVKRSFVIIEFKGITSITAINNWLKMPKNRYTDVVTYSWTGAKRYQESGYNPISKTQYTCDFYAFRDGLGTENYTVYHEEDFSNLLKKKNSFDDNHLIGTFDLPPDDREESGRGFYGHDILETFSYKVTFYLIKTSDTLSFYYDYQHQKEKINKVSASALILGLGGISTNLFAPFTTPATIGTILGLVSQGFGIANLFSEYYSTIGEDGHFEYKFK